MSLIRLLAPLVIGPLFILFLCMKIPFLFEWRKLIDLASPSAQCLQHITNVVFRSVAIPHPNPNKTNPSAGVTTEPDYFAHQNPLVWPLSVNCDAASLVHNRYHCLRAEKTHTKCQGWEEADFHFANRNFTRNVKSNLSLRSFCQSKNLEMALESCSKVLQSQTMLTVNVHEYK